MKSSANFEEPSKNSITLMLEIVQMMIFSDIYTIQHWKMWRKLIEPLLFYCCESILQIFEQNKKKMLQLQEVSNVFAPVVISLERVIE